MSYNTRHNNRQSLRFTKNFVPAGTNHQTFEVLMSQPGQAAPAPEAPAHAAPAPAAPPAVPPPPPQFETIKTEPGAEAEAEAGAEAEAEAGAAGGSKPRLPFFRTKLSGVKKISNKERRRRQNHLLRRLATPKNALMCINEILPHEQIASQFKVCPAAAGGVYSSGNNFHAELTLDGVTYRGYGETKLAARNAVAEQAIRDIVLKKMQRVADAAPAPASAEEGSGGASGAAMEGVESGAGGASGAEGGGGGAEGEAAEGEALPMIQLLSFALHKLFAEWEAHGHRVPHLQKRRGQSQAEEDMELEAAGGGPLPPPPSAPPAPLLPGGCKKPRVLPETASSMHPAMVLSIMRPCCNYREVSAEGDRPQNMVFTMAVDIDDQTYFGKAPNKKEARKNAARAACKTLFGITFDDELRR